jgi:hypothetical protein
VKNGNHSKFAYLEKITKYAVIAFDFVLPLILIIRN